MTAPRGRPEKYDSPTRQYSVRIPENLADELQAWADFLDCSFTEALNSVLAQWCEDTKKGGKK